MQVSEQVKNNLIIEQKVMVNGQPRWVARTPDQDTSLLILTFDGEYYAVPLFCEHAHTSMLQARLNSDGQLICPKHGMASDIRSGKNTYPIVRSGNQFFIKQPNDPQRIPVESGLCVAEDSDEVAVLKTVNSALQKKVLANLESMDLMLSQVEQQKNELEQNNQHLISVNELISSVMNSIDECIIVTDNLGRITRINRYSEEILQVKAEQLTGLSPDELLSPQTLDDLKTRFPAKSWDKRPYIYRAVYREQGFEQVVSFKDLSSQSSNLPTSAVKPFGADASPVERQTETRSFLLRGTLLYNYQGKEEGLILSATDISVVQEQERAKRQQEIEKHLQLLQTTLASISYGVAMFDASGQLLTSNQLFDDLITAQAYSSQANLAQVIDSHQSNTTHPHSNQASYDFTLLFAGPSIESQVGLPDYRHLYQKKTSWSITYHDGTIVECDAAPSPSGGFVVTVCDVTEKRRMDQHVRLLSSAVEQSTSEVIITDTEGQILYVNPMFTENTGYSAEEAIGKKTSLVRSGEMPKAFYKELWQAIKEDKSWKGEVINRKKNGDKFWQSMSIAPIHDTEGKVSHYISLKSDISKQKEAESQLRYQAEHDLLTGLPNRAVLLTEMSKAITAARQHNSMSAVLFMDLDNFKDVNDTLGHLQGDLLLQLVAQRLQDLVSDVDVISRLGGDEFAIIQNDIQHKAESAKLAGALIEAVSKPFVIEDHQLHIGLSIGITLLPDDGLETGALLSNADIAMYEAKAISGSCYQFFDQELQQKIQRKKLIEEQLHSAIANDELTLVFQAKIDIKSGRIVGAEALIRWTNDSLGFVPPDEFITIAEQSGQIIELGNWVINKTLNYLAHWKQSSVDMPKIAVNLSTVQLHDIKLVEDIQTALITHGISPDKLELEVTETAAMTDADFSMQQLNRIKDLGISLAMDDFGTGYSSLSYLASLPIDRIKIDRAFVNDIQHSKQARALIESIIHLGKIMDKTVIAEGVEEQAQLDLLQKLGCDEAQGYFISKPIGADDYLAFVLAKEKMA